MTVGQIVYSKCGRDKGKAFVVVSVTEPYSYLVDGKTRPLNRPKKKKAKHIQPTHTVVELSAAAGSGGLSDADIRKLLLPFKTVRQ